MKQDKIKKLKDLRIAYQLSMEYDAVPSELIDNEEGINNFLDDFGDNLGNPSYDDINEICKEYLGYSDYDLTNEILDIIKDL